MARQISELHSLPFQKIIGAPLLALVQGQAQAAQATAEFIEKIGFESAETAGQGDLGGLRMVTFSYQKPDDQGNLQSYIVEVPLLSLIPIPSIEIKNAEMEFNIKITDIQTETTSLALSSSDAEEGNWLSNERVEFRAAMGKMQSNTSGQTETDIQMKVKINAQQADIPTGLAHIFRLMDQSINSKKEIDEQEG
ncbi:MAG: DUF2589 domain-containing protein [Cyclobacteriaceae bacterium]|nr:DUF2589 domain-containing protein [Cyclobacteriaceae bacterium]